MPAWPGITGYTRGVLGQSDRADGGRSELDGLETQRARRRGAARRPRRLAADRGAIRSCRPMRCRSASRCSATTAPPATARAAAGGKGYPNLRDDVWLWGGSLDDIQHTIQVGVRSGQPQARGETHDAGLRPRPDAERRADRRPDRICGGAVRPARPTPAAVARARQSFADQCAACHGPAGTGDRRKGAPNLTDAEWLYGADRDAIRDQIWNGRNGVMPTWEARFSPGDDQGAGRLRPRQRRRASESGDVASRRPAMTVVIDRVARAVAGTRRPPVSAAAPRARRRRRGGGLYKPRTPIYPEAGPRPLAARSSGRC